MSGESCPSLRRRSGDRVLAAALLVSASIHALILLSAGGPPAAGGSVTLRATLHEPPPAAPAVPAPTPPSPAEPVAAPKAAVPLPEPVERTYPKPVAAGDAETAADSAPAAANAPAQAASGGAPSADAAATPQPPRPAIDMNGLRQYHAALSRAATRFRNYPAQARQAGWDGQVVMRLSISETGAPIGLELVDSSGHAILDRAAIEMMGLAAGHTPVPESLRGRAFSIDLAARYNLRDEP